MTLTLTLQGWFYVLTGLWPILHMRSFEFISGEKTDKWLVKTVGLLIASSGCIFIIFNDTRAAVTLAIMNAVFLSAIDIFYSIKKVISKIYLLDAIIECGFVMLYLYRWE